MEKSFDFQEFLRYAVKVGASDIHLRVNMLPAIRKTGKIVKIDTTVITENLIQSILEKILPKNIKTNALSALDLDFAYEVPNLSRFRVNMSRQLGQTALVFRIIPYKIPSVNELNLPNNILQFVNESDGLVIISGATGCGKSTTIASLLEVINVNFAKHIITIEDPIEYIFNEEKCIVSQRQIGSDTNSYPEGVKYALRQDPDIIFIGEIRDKETVATALKAAETGHLVFATLHTNDAIQTINRIINFFDPQDREFVKYQLANTLKGTIAQKLIPRIDIENARIPACEILVNTSTVKDLILKNKLEHVYDLVKHGNVYDMLTMNQSLFNWVQNGVINPKTAILYSNNKIELQQMLRGAYTGTQKG